MGRKDQTRDRRVVASSMIHNATTQPFMPRITEPIPSLHLRQSWSRRLLWNVSYFFASIIRKINQVLGFALAVLLLLLFTRFILDFFALSSSLFVQWVFMLSTPLLWPFENLLPTLPYDGFRINVTVLVAIIVYTLAVTIVRQFLKLFVGK